MERDDADYNAVKAELALLLTRSGSNYKRVARLSAFYARFARSLSGEKKLDLSDILRSAVVFLHATLEDTLRTVAALHLPYGGKAVIDAIPLAGFGHGQRPEKFLLGDLLPHRSRTVDGLIRKSIVAYLAKVSFNNTSDLMALVGNLGFATQDYSPFLPALAQLMNRRHKIVHQADLGGQRSRTPQRLTLIQVERWHDAVMEFNATLMTHATTTSIIRRKRQQSNKDDAHGKVNGRGHR